MCGAMAFDLLCTGCHAELPRNAHAMVCPICDEPGHADAMCGACLAEPPHFDLTVSAFAYAFPLDRLVQRYKFSAHLALTDLFADALMEAIGRRAVELPNVVVPMPLAHGRLAHRGFNQSALIAARIGERLKLPVERDALARTRETMPQSGLSRAARFRNVRGAFSSRRLMEGRRVAIVDDVMTTGNTLSEAARALKAAGAASVQAWVVARAVHR